MSRKHHPRRIPSGDMACIHHDSLGRGSSCSVRRINGTGGVSRSVRNGRSSSASVALSECGTRVCRVSSARAWPERADRVIEPWRDDPFPDDDTEPVIMEANVSDHRDRSGLPTCGPARSTTGPLRCSDRPRRRTTRDPTLILTLQPDSRILSTMNSLLHAASTGACPYRPKSDFLSICFAKPSARRRYATA
jgi:hypothetical protein